MKRRKHPRIEPLVIRAEFRFGEKTREGHLTSLSEVGAFLATGERIPVGQKLALRLSLPWQMGDIDTEAQVVCAIPGSGLHPQNRTAGVGLAFVGLSSDDRERIISYMSRFYRMDEQFEEQPD